MFNGCYALTILKLSTNFDMFKVTSTTDMFTNCYLKTTRGVDFNGAPADTQNKINALLA
jgi:hypothetical protein